jgi:alkylation response protein AidB-like acyl-CoA dehydrogenase
MNSPGIEVHPIITIDGRHSLNRVTFDNVRVPAQNRIGEEGQGWHYANFLLGNERTSYAHVAGKRMQMAAIEQFMESIGEQDHQTQFNDLSVRLDTLDVTVLRVLATVANGESPGNESSILKIMATELAQDITELGMVVRQYAGIASFSAEMPDRAGAKAMVDYLGTRSQSIYGGSNEIQKNIIAKRVLGL